MNELFDDFSNNDKNKWNKNKKIITTKSAIFLVLIGVTLMVFWYLLIQKDIAKVQNKTEVYIEPQNWDIVEKTDKKLLYSEFFTDNSWGKDIITSKFSNYWWAENLTIQEDKSIKVIYPKWSYKPSANPRGWAGFIYNIWETSDVLALNYDIEFADNFDFVRWWKLPWLCGWDCPRGWSESDNGFSVRFSWKKGGFLDTYSVFPGSSTYWDYSWTKMFQFESGKKYNIKQKIKLNTPGKSDWVLQVFVNDKSVYLNPEMLYRNKENIKINSLFFNTFFWWSDETWATPNDTYIIFNNLKIEK